MNRGQSQYKSLNKFENKLIKKESDAAATNILHAFI